MLGFEKVPVVAVYLAEAGAHLHSDYREAAGSHWTALVLKEYRYPDSVGHIVILVGDC